MIIRNTLTILSFLIYSFDPIFRVQSIYKREGDNPTKRRKLTDEFEKCEKDNDLRLSRGPSIDFKRCCFVVPYVLGI